MWYSRRMEVVDMDVWDVIDLINLLLLSLQILNRFTWEQTYPIILNFEKYGNTNEYVNFSQLSSLFESERLLTGISGFLIQKIER